MQIKSANKSTNFQYKRAHNLETLGGIYEKNAKLLQTSLLKNCGKLASLLPKIGGDHTQKVATEKHRFTTSKEA